MPKYIMGKDFHKNVGAIILMPHPTNPYQMPVEVLIESVDKKQVILKKVDDEEMRLKSNYSDDKNKYLVIKDANT